MPANMAKNMVKMKHPAFKLVADSVSDSSSFSHVDMRSWGTVSLAKRMELTVGCFVAGKNSSLSNLRLQRFNMQLQPAVCQERDWQPAIATDDSRGYWRL